jgi:hypothetical protein
VADDFEARAQEIINGGGPNVIADVKRLARQMKLEKQGFKPDPSGGMVRPSTKQTQDPSPAQAPSFGDKMSAFGEGASEGSAAMLAGAAKNYAFGLPDKALGAAIPGYREAADALVKEQPISAGIGTGLGIVGSGAAGPEALISKGAQLVTKGARAAVPALAGTAIGRIASAGGEAALAGGASAGASSLAQGRSLGEAGRDAVTGAKMGGLIGAPLAAAGEGGRKVIGGAVGKLKERIVSEVGDGASATSSKRLAKADDAIAAEAITGPDAPVVRDAYMSRADSGRKKLAPIIKRVGAENDAAYGLFEQTGRSALSADDYLARVDTGIADAVADGNERLVSVLEKFRERATVMAEKNGGLTLTQARGLTTGAQGTATSVLGSLHEHANARAARQAEAVITSAMDETLSAAAAGIPELENAATTIRANNQRFHGLLSIDDALKLRVPKEASQKSGLERVAAKIAQPAALGAMGGFMHSPSPLGAVAGAATVAGLQYGIPAGARAISKGITTAAINQARRGGGAGIPSAALPAAIVAPQIQARQAEQGRDRRRIATLRGNK